MIFMFFLLFIFQIDCCFCRQFQFQRDFCNICLTSKTYFLVTFSQLLFYTDRNKLLFANTSLGWTVKKGNLRQCICSIENWKPPQSCTFPSCSLWINILLGNWACGCQNKLTATGIVRSEYFRKHNIVTYLKGIEIVCVCVKR